MNLSSSRDGFSSESFHRNCDNKGTTIWVAKVQGSAQLVGGYNPFDWNGNDVWKTTTDSFIFNFTDGKNISTAKLGYVNNPSKAIYCHNDNGPCMSIKLYCSSGNRWNYNGNGNTDYPDIGIPTAFTVEGYEVFQVIKR